MQPKTGRIALMVLLGAVAIFDLAEAILVFAGICAPPANYQDTLFRDSTVPMLLLAVVGGSALFAAGLGLLRSVWSTFVAAAAGLLMIAWEIAHNVIAHQFLAIWVVTGLGIIALCEYLWAMDRQGEPRPPMSHAVVRIALLALEAFILVTAVDGGLGMLRGDLDEFLSVAWLAGTPFRDYTIPALILVVVVGGSALLAATTVFIQRAWAVLLSAGAGLIMAGFEVVEAIAIDGKVGDLLLMTVGMQLVWFVAGVAVCGLAVFLWRREYLAQDRSRIAYHRQTSHA